jgi:hypothetical protein
MLKLRTLGVLGVLTAVMLSMATSSAFGKEWTLTESTCASGTVTWAVCYELVEKKKTTEPFTAVECNKEKATLCELEGEESETVAGGTIVFTAKTAPAQKIECEKSEGSGTISQLHPLETGEKTTLKGKLKYKGCLLITEPMKKCVVNTENETVELLGTLENEKELKLEPESGATFLTITYKNNGSETCPASFAGEHAVTGTQIVEILNPEVDEETKKGKAIGHTLKFFSNEAELSQELTLTFENKVEKSGETEMTDFYDIVLA